MPVLTMPHPQQLLVTSKHAALNVSTDDASLAALSYAPQTQHYLNLLHLVSHYSSQLVAEHGSTS